jgi:tRNA threonylcarbamoyl adenosine modification protein YeaZ
MGKGLAIETSGRVGSVAAFLDGRLLAEETFEHGLANAARLVVTMDALCRQQGWRPGDVNELYISIGPGSFTGLRLAVTVAKTMWLATGVRIVAVPSVRVLACNAPPEATNLIVVLDAKRGQVFTARFESHGGPICVTPISPSPCTQGEDRGGGSSVLVDPSIPLAATPLDPHPNPPPGYKGRGQVGSMEIVEAAHLDTLSAMLARSPRPVWLLGEGLDYHRPEIPVASDVIVTDQSLWRARAAAVGELGTQMAAAGQWADAMTLSPLYIRPPEAEEKADARAAAELAAREAPK